MQKLNEEAEAKKVPIVSRETPAPYRIRGYVALGIQKKQKRTIVSWVWDVYDAEQKRSFRLAGEEIAGPAGRDAWDAANDEVLGRVARAGMESLTAYFQSPGSVAPAPSTEPVPSSDGDRNMTVASVPGRDDFRPEFAGHIPPVPDRSGRSSGSHPCRPNAPVDATIPLPRRRPASAGRASDDKVAMAAPGL